MSMFLGPIHKWLYNQINIIERREQNLLDKFTQEYGREVKDIVQPLREKYGTPKQDKPLEELVGNSQIHPWLESAIIAAQSREASLVKTLLERMPCDRLSQAKQEDQEIIWEHDAKLHQEFWLTAGVDLKLMHDLYSTWIEAFVKSLNPDISYERRIKQDYYADVLSQ
ncbi:MAG: hypothetical protein ACQEQG_06605 [Bacillota bacterium]